jgi:hypothetical protein
VVVSTRSLKVISALVWYIGGVVLLLKGGSLLAEAESLRPGEAWPWLAAAVGIVIGVLKAKLFFTRSCQRNLERIDALERPRIWQFFRPGFFLFLGLMILLGASLSGMAHDNHAFLIAVAIVDVGIASALLASSHVFWRQKPLTSTG